MNLGPYANEILESARLYNVDPLLIRAVILTESSENPNAISPAGAVGLMQLMPTTAAEMNITYEQLFVPWINIDVGTNYLAKQIERFGDINTALAAYNAGPGRVSSGKPLPDETIKYIQKVSKTWYELGGTSSDSTMDSYQVTIDWVPLILVSLLVLAGTIYIRARI